MGSENGKIAKKSGNGSWFFKIFKGFARLVAKSCEIWPQETETGSKIAWKPWFLKKTRAFLAKTLKNCLFFQKKSPETEIEGLETLNLAQKSNFSRLHLSILAKSCGFLPPETDMGSKIAWKKHAPFGKKFEIYKIFHPQTGNRRLLLRFYVTIFSIFKQNKPIFLF